MELYIVLNNYCKVLDIIHDIMNAITKYPAAFVLFLVAVAAAFVAWYSTVKDSQQKDNIETLGEQTKKLGELNKSIGEKIQVITNENNRLSKINIDLTSKATDLISEVKHLTEKSKELIDKVDKRTENEEAENLLTGELKMGFQKDIHDEDTVKITFAHEFFTGTIKAIKKDVSRDAKRADVILFGGAGISMHKFVTIHIGADNRVLFNVKIFNTEGNLVAEIINNFWRPSRNFIGKYNYDDTGFEVIDSKGNIVFNIDILGNNNIKIQGIFPVSDIKKMHIISNTQHIQFDMIKTETDIKAYNSTHTTDYETELQNAINSVQIKQLFEYTGKKWVKRRKEY
jgi:hypothetical protein